MRIEGWHAEGFGVFRDFAVQSVSPGLNVFLGPNEAGKSTLLTFIRAMLFGTRGAERRHEPLRGGRYGGRLLISDGAGESYTVERVFGRRAVPRIIRGDGSETPEAILSQLLGGCDKSLFEAVFAFDLSQLQSLKALNEEGVRDRIFSTGIVGAGVDARGAIQSLEKRQAELLRPRADQARINHLFKEIRDVQQRIQKAREMAEGYEAVRALEAQSAEAVATLRRSIESTRAEQANANRLLLLWPSWHERREAIAALTELDASARSGMKEALFADVDALYADLALHRERLNRLPELQSRCRSAVEALDEKLRDLGPHWDRARLTAFDRSIPTSDDVRLHEDRLTTTTTTLERSEAVLRQAEDQLADAERERQERQDELEKLPVPPTMARIDEMGRAVSRLRSGIADLMAAQVRRDGTAGALEQANWQTREASSQLSWCPPAWLAPALIALAVAAGGLAYWLSTASGPTGMAVCAVIAAALVATALVVRGRRARVRAARTRENERLSAILAEAEAALERDRTAVRQLEAQIAVDAATLGLPALPTSADIEAITASIGRELASRQAYEARERDLALSTKHLQVKQAQTEAARVASEVTRANRDDARAAWDTWKQQAGVPANLASPRSVLDFFNAIGAGRELLRNAIAAERENAQIVEAIVAYEARVAAVLGAVGWSTAVDRRAIPTAVESLSSHATQSRQVRRRRDELKRVIDQAEARIAEQIGTGEHAARVIEELSTGDIATWRATSEERTAQLVTMEEQHTEALRAHRDTEKSRQSIETSADIARLAVDDAALREELIVAVRDWQVLVLAQTLIEETLAHYQRERQPEVLAHASGLFGSATVGRYVQIVQQENDLQIVDQEGGRRGVEALSRGTAEQLYLCIRLGLAAEFARRTTSLPLVMDDILVNFDPERARAIAGQLIEFAREHQILLFTCHPATVELLRDLSGDCNCYTMRRFGEGGEWLTNQIDSRQPLAVPA
ncbi:MAG: hypothetical protein QOF33_2834 [Thermomicrobiales bacterium]|nr:hypothetical protein [Thermomicrobiales bacterium]